MSKKTTITAREAIQKGIEPAILWNVQRDKETDIDIFIVAALKNGYNEKIIKDFITVFSKDKVLNAFKKYEERVSEKLYMKVKKICEEN